MITEDQQTYLKEILKGGYSDKVASLLEARGHRNKYGLPHSKEYIRQIFNGHRSDANIERAIFDIYEQTLKENKEENARRANILKQKTEAGTSV